jgi:hypothetical protein
MPGVDHRILVMGTVTVHLVEHLCSPVIRPANHDVSGSAGPLDHGLMDSPVDRRFTMRSLNLATFAVIGMASLANARQSVPEGYVRDGLGTGRDPVSTRASNILPENSRSMIAPALPEPALGSDAAPHEYLRAARAALAAGRTGEAQQSLEMAETRVLTRAIPPEAAATPDPNPAVNQIRSALHALGEGDRARALQIIDATAN